MRKHKHILFLRDTLPPYAGLPTMYIRQCKICGRYGATYRHLLWPQFFKDDSVPNSYFSVRSDGK